MQTLQEIKEKLKPQSKQEPVQSEALKNISKESLDEEVIDAYEASDVNKLSLLLPKLAKAYKRQKQELDDANLRIWELEEYRKILEARKPVPRKPE